MQSTIKFKKNDYPIKFLCEAAVLTTEDSMSKLIKNFYPKISKPILKSRKDI
ncbi:hypothetical protein LEP1GSC037_5081 [Leptospira interrogans str. 2006001854]|uniref:Uncharacterized protein n=1 Tax=Leptospira interrogans str. 2006001854 TaxID=1001590 RepID=M6GQ72_LEPIR|nr:hypothetical protein LEP1GSC037_5081 [Leptospira interrogans str. 2006001854]